MATSNRLTIQQIKEALIDNGHEDRVFALDHNDPRPKKADWVRLYDRCMGKGSPSRAEEGVRTIAEIREALIDEGYEDRVFALERRTPRPRREDWVRLWDVTRAAAVPVAAAATPPPAAATATATATRIATAREMAEWFGRLRLEALAEAEAEAQARTGATANKK